MQLLKPSEISLIKAIIIRDFKATYSRTLFGNWLALLTPVVYLAVFIFFRLMFKLPTSEDIPMIPFLFSGLAVWLFFATSLGGIFPSISSNMGIMRKMPVNPLCFVASSLASPILTMIIYLALLFCMCIFYGIYPAISWLTLPFLLICILLFTLSIGLPLCALSIYKRDIVMLLPIALQLGMFVTPIFFPPSLVPDSLQWVVLINPMALYVSMFRDALFLGTMPSLLYLTISLGVTALLGCIGYPLFSRTMRYASDSI